MPEDEAYKFPPGPKRHKILVSSYANRAKWYDEVKIKAEVIETPIGQKQW